MRLSQRALKRARFVFLVVMSNAGGGEADQRVRRWLEIDKRNTSHYHYARPASERFQEVPRAPELWTPEVGKEYRVSFDLANGQDEMAYFLSGTRSGRFSSRVRHSPGWSGELAEQEVRMLDRGLMFGWSPFPQWCGPPIRVPFGPKVP